MVAVDYKTAQKNSFFELATSILKSGYILKKLEVVKIEEIV